MTGGTGRDDVHDDSRACHPVHTTIQVVADNNGTVISDLAAARDIVQAARAEPLSQDRVRLESRSMAIR
jgi:hypothetical protein